MEQLVLWCKEYEKQIGILLIVLVSGIVVYGHRVRIDEHTDVIHMRVVPQGWKFEPEVFTATLGKDILLEIENTDSRSYGLAIDAFGIDAPLPERRTTQVHFFAKDIGDFPFYCPLSCDKDGASRGVRGRFDMVGMIHVRPATTTPELPEN